MMPAAATVVDGQHPDSANVATIADRADDGQDAASPTAFRTEERLVTAWPGVVRLVTPTFGRPFSRAE